MYHNPIKFFKHFLFLSIISIIIILLSISLLSIGPILGYVALILILIDSIILMKYWLLSIFYLLKSFFDKDVKKGYVIRLLNVLFTTLILGLIGIFYLTVILGSLIILLPFLA